MDIPPIVITMGEPAGVGPELTIKAKKILRDKIPFFVIGDFNYLTLIANSNHIKTQKIQESSETFKYPDKLCIFDNKVSEKIVPGQISFQNSTKVKENIELAVTKVIKKEASAIVTNPINKWAIKKSSIFPFEGHTDFLASLDPQKNNSVMMLTNANGFRVVPITVHIPLKQVSSKLNPQLVKNTIITLNESLKNDFQIKNPKILITGINPHAGENSTIGFEEQDVMTPIIIKLKKNGLNLVGPVAADTAFTREKRSLYDAVVCAYHDQALIPIKTLSFDESINITLGLSFIRTSPDHGTALDIAGKNIANPQSLIFAIQKAYQIVRVRKKNE